MIEVEVEVEVEIVIQYEYNVFAKVFISVVVVDGSSLGDGVDDRVDDWG